MRTARHVIATDDQRPDVIVVGSGLSGAFAARMLADAGLRMLIVEAGCEPPEHPPGVDPAAVAPPEQLADDDTEWPWICEGMPGEWVRVRRPGGRSRIWGGWF